MSSSDMARAAERLLHIDARLEGSSLEDLTSVQSEYVREVQKAMAEADLSIEIEALKSLGDVFLEKGKISSVSAEFSKAYGLYSVALTCCTNIGQVQTMLHRVKYARTFIDKTSPLNQHGGKRKLYREVKQEQEQVSVSPSDRLKIAETVEARFAELTEESLRAGYVNLLVESVTASDVLAEVEALKGLGDEHLRRGGVTRDLADFTRASALYSAGLARCQDADNRDALRHRVNYTARLRMKEVKGKYKSYEGKAIEIQYEYPNDTIDSEDEDELVQRESNEQNAERSYVDHYDAGVNALKNGSLESAERSFASALRLVHGNQEELAKEAGCLRVLGDVHVAKGKNTGDGKAFSQAAALYNGALVRTEDATVKRELNEKLKDTEVSFLQHAAHTDCRPSVSDVDRGHNESIQNIREKVRQRLESVDQQFNLQAHREDNRAMTKLEAQRAEAIKDFFVEIAQNRKEFVGVLVDECMEVLGSAPCKYAVIGLGSQATETVTPYSDLEFAILLDEGCDTDENKQYFRLLTHYLHLKVINLGETIIPAMAIKSLNDFESSNPADNWFYDSVTPRGFAFDGAMPWASKTPLGRDKTKAKPALELIRSPSSMAELQQEDVAVSEGYHLSDILRNVCCLTGDDGLVNDYMKIVNKTLATTRRQGGSGVLRARDTLAKDVERYGKQGLTAKLLDVKKDIYRFPTISIDSLCVLCGLKPGSVWKIISDMTESNIVTRENADHLKVLVSISAELRLRTYLANGKQLETMSALSPIATDGQTGAGDRKAAFKSVFYLPDDDMLFRYHYRAMPLEKFLASISTDHLPESLRRLRSTNLFDANSSVRARICIQLLKHEEAICHLEHDVARLLNTVEPFKQLDVLEYLDVRCISDESLVALLRKIAAAWKLLGNGRKAISYYEMALRIEKAVHGRDSCHAVIANIFGDLGSAWLALDDNKEALGHLTIAHNMRREIYGDDATHPKILSSLSSLAEAWQYGGNFRKAMSIYEVTLRVTKKQYKDDDLKLAMCLKNMGGCLSNLGDSRQAIRYQEKALKIIRSTYGYNTGHPRVVSTLKELGQSYIEVSDYKTGIYYLEQALKAWKIVYGERANHPDIASALSDLGLAWNSAGDFIVSQKYHDLALKMRGDIYGDATAHSDIVYSLQNIGFTLSNEGKHKEALEYQEQALAMLKRVHGDGANHPDIANALNHLGKCYCNVANYERAKESFQEALAMWEACYGSNSNHPDVAGALNNLGIVSRRTGDQRKAISYHRQALEIAERAFGRETPHSLIANAYNNMASAYGEVGDHERAIEYNKKALSMWEAIHGSCSPYVLQTLMNLATSCDMGGQKREAIRYNQEALEMCEVVYGRDKDHPRVATILSNLGLILSESFEFDKALCYLEKSLEMKKRVFGDLALPSVAKTLEIIAGVWLKRGDHVDAVKYLGETLETLTIIYGDRANMHVAGVLAKLSFCWEILEDNQQAIDYNERTLHMLKLVCDDPRHPGIVSTQDSLQRLRRLMVST